MVQWGEGGVLLGQPLGPPHSTVEQNRAHPCWAASSRLLGNMSCFLLGLCLEEALSPCMVLFLCLKLPEIMFRVNMHLPSLF